MVTLFAAVGVVLALLCITAETDQPRRLYFKVGATASITLLAVTLRLDEQAAWWLYGAFMLCLLGDLFLALAEKYFIAGLVAFLAGHVLFSAHILANYSIGEINHGVSFAVIGGSLALATVIFRHHKSQRVAISAYIAIIGFLLWTASQASLSGANVLLAVGALVFVISDTTLAIDRFVMPIKYRHWLVLGTYWTALMLLAFYA